jgi:hypothetical protein
MVMVLSFGVVTALADPVDEPKAVEIVYAYRGGDETSNYRLPVGVNVDYDVTGFTGMTSAHAYIGAPLIPAQITWLDQFNSIAAFGGYFPLGKGTTAAYTIGSDVYVYFNNVRIGTDKISFIYYPDLDFEGLEVLPASTYNTLAFRVSGIFQNEGEQLCVVWNNQPFILELDVDEDGLSMTEVAPGVFEVVIEVGVPDENWFKPESTIYLNIIDLDARDALEDDFEITLDLFDADLGDLFFEPEEGWQFDFGTRDFREDLSDIGQPLLIVDMSTDRNVALDITSNPLQYFEIDEGIMSLAALSASKTWVYDIEDEMLLLDIKPQNGLGVGVWTETIVLTIGYLDENGILMDEFEVEFEARVRINPIRPDLPVLINAFATGFSGEIGIIVDWPEDLGFNVSSGSEARIVAILYDCEEAALSGSAEVPRWIQWIYLDPDSLVAWFNGDAADGFYWPRSGFGAGGSTVSGLADDRDYWVTLRLDTATLFNGELIYLMSDETNPRLVRLEQTDFIINWQTGGGVFNLDGLMSFRGGDSFVLPTYDAPPAGGNFEFKGWYLDRNFAEEDFIGMGGVLYTPASTGGQFQNISLWARWDRVQVVGDDLKDLTRADIRIRPINGAYNLPLGRGLFELFNPNAIGQPPIVDTANVLDLRILTGNANLLTFNRNATEGVFTYNALRTGAVAVQVQARLWVNGVQDAGWTTVETRIINVR